MSTCRMTSQCVSWERNQRPASAGLKLEPCLSRTQTGTLPQLDSNWNPASAGLKLEPCLSRTQNWNPASAGLKLEPCLSWTQTAYPRTVIGFMHASSQAASLPTSAYGKSLNLPSMAGRSAASHRRSPLRIWQVIIVAFDPIRLGKADSASATRASGALGSVRV